MKVERENCQVGEIRGTEALVLTASFFLMGIYSPQYNNAYVFMSLDI